MIRLATTPLVFTLRASLGLALVGATPLSAGELYVDATANCASGNGSAANPFCTIEEAILAARRGDTIHVAPGTYTENVRLRKDVSLVGDAGADATIVRAQGPGPVVTLITGTTHTLRGLTLEGGTGYVSVYPFRRVYRGGGVFMGATTASLTLEEVCVRDNTAAVDPYEGLGGGIYNHGGTLTIRNSTVTGNAVGGGGLGIGGLRAGGGIASGGVLTLQNSTVSGNLVTNYGDAEGGGLYVWGTAYVEDSEFHGNQVLADYGAIGSGIANRGNLVVRGCTFTANAGRYPAAVASFYFAPALLESSIVWGNTPAPYVNLEAVGGQLTTVRYSVVEDGWSGAGSGILDADPRFVAPAAGNFALAPNSPCIDAGDPAAAPAKLDHGGNPRLNDGNLDRRLRIDMGAHEFTNLRLAVSGSPTPGGTLRIDTAGTGGTGGTGGLEAWLAVSLVPASTLVRPLGVAAFDPAAPLVKAYLGPVPGSRSFAIPATTPTPLAFTLQALGIGAPLPNGRRPANYSNPVLVEVE